MNQRARRVRSVAARIVMSYSVVLLVFACSAAWSVWTFRVAVRETEQLRSGYLPLSLSVRDLVSNQDSWNTQLNHVTTAGNPTDIRIWFETALSVGRPAKFAGVRRVMDRTFVQNPEEAVRRDMRAELDQIEQAMRADQAEVRSLFAALARDDSQTARVLRDELVRRGLRIGRSLSRLEEHITGHIDGIVEAARVREQTALWLLIVFGLLTILLGALMTLYARRVVAPITVVTRRAEAVARGDLSPRPVIDSGDEIGQLSQTFETMVEAIGDTRERLLAAERLAAIGKMAAHVTHEVRNPLSSIALNLDLLEEELGGETDEARTLLRAIGQEVQRLSGLSDQYLSMARRAAPELQERDLAPLIQSATEFMRREVERNGIELEVNIAEGLPWVEVDEGQLRQALYNLVRNAREALAGGGHIHVRARCDEQWVLIEVQDNGPGVPEAEAERLFDPFFTTKNHGTGLGLAVTREIAAAHGGSLRYKPATGGGSCFVIALPVRARGAT